jgi:hypothetical protein
MKYKIFLIWENLITPSQPTHLKNEFCSCKAAEKAFMKFTSTNLSIHEYNELMVGYKFGHRYEIQNTSEV